MAKVTVRYSDGLQAQETIECSAIRNQDGFVSFENEDGIVILMVPCARIQEIRRDDR